VGFATCGQCGASAGDAEQSACSYCGALLPHAAEAARKAAMVRELLADRSGDGMPDLVSSMLGDVADAGASRKVIRSSDGTTVIVESTSTTVSTISADGNLHGALPDGVRQQVEQALGRLPGSAPRGSGGHAAPAAVFQAISAGEPAASRPGAPARQRASGRGRGVLILAIAAVVAGLAVMVAL
jgi:hypothetical protein